MEVDVNERGREALARMTYQDACGVVFAIFTRSLQHSQAARERARAAREKMVAAVTGSGLGLGDANRFEQEEAEATGIADEHDKLVDALAIVLANTREPAVRVHEGLAIVQTHPLAGMPEGAEVMLVGEAALDKLRKGEALTDDEQRQLALVTNTKRAEVASRTKLDPCIPHPRWHDVCRTHDCPLVSLSSKKPECTIARDIREAAERAARGEGGEVTHLPGESEFQRGVRLAFPDAVAIDDSVEARAEAEDLEAAEMRDAPITADRAALDEFGRSWRPPSEPVDVNAVTDAGRSGDLSKLKCTTRVVVTDKAGLRWDLGVAASVDAEAPVEDDVLSDRWTGQVVLRQSNELSSLLDAMDAVEQHFPFLVLLLDESTEHRTLYGKTTIAFTGHPYGATMHFGASQWVAGGPRDDLSGWRSASTSQPAVEALPAGWTSEVTVDRTNGSEDDMGDDDDAAPVVLDDDPAAAKVTVEFTRGSTTPSVSVTGGGFREPVDGDERDRHGETTDG